MKSTATAQWNGGLKDGNGTISAAGGAFTDTPYNFGKRFEGATGPGTTPEELIAAAHASCFSMALSAELGKAGHPPVSIQTEAVVTLQPVDGKPTVVSSALTTRVKVDLDDETFQKIAAGAKVGCPISRLLNTEISLDAQLVG
jgi:osmotically inducible protein OsmC